MSHYPARDKSSGHDPQVQSELPKNRLDEFVHVKLTPVVAAATKQRQSGHSQVLFRHGTYLASKRAGQMMHCGPAAGAAESVQPVMLVPC